MPVVLVQPAVENPGQMQEDHFSNVAKEEGAQVVILVVVVVATVVGPKNLLHIQMLHRFLIRTTCSIKKKIHL